MSSSKKKASRQEIKSTRTIGSGVLIISVAVILLILFYFIIIHSGDKWSVDDKGILSYPENRGHVNIETLSTETAKNESVRIISFVSKDYTVEGILRTPASGKKVPGILILPGATVSKEGTQELADIFSEMGYASLGIEQRNRGGVDIKNDYLLWKKNEEPLEHKMVYDALRSVDVLRQEPAVDPEKIAIVGISNGGRFAIIATALDTHISGVAGISTSGYDTEAQIIDINSQDIIKFYRSIDPESYLRFLPPRKLVMLHSVNDTIIPIIAAESTFEKAKEPKQFYSINSGTHGYSAEMREPLEKELRIMFGNG